MRYRHVALGIAALLIGLAASSAGAQQGTSRADPTAFLLGGWAADESLRFDPFSLATLPATKARSGSAVTPAAAPISVSATAPSPAPAESAAASPAESITASGATGAGVTLSLRPPIRIPYRPVLRSPFRPPLF